MDHCSLVYKVDVSIQSSLLSSLVLLNTRICLLLNTESKVTTIIFLVSSPKV